MSPNELKQAYRTRLRDGEVVYWADAFSDDEPLVAKKGRYQPAEDGADPWITILLDGGNDTEGTQPRVDTLTLFTAQEAVALLRKHNPVYELEIVPLDTIVGNPDMNREMAHILMAGALDRIAGFELPPQPPAPNA